MLKKSGGSKSPDVSFVITYNKTQQIQCTLPAAANGSHIGKVLQQQLPDIDIDTVKLLHKGRTWRLPQISSLSAAGIGKNSKLTLMASTKNEVQAVQHAVDQSKTLPSFEHEEKREIARQRPPQPSSSSSPKDQMFQRFEAWQFPGLVPSQKHALDLLYRLAADSGIVGVMKKHNWKVGLLSEMPPEGKVGISPVCILGVNINQGQEISLRLRTDDLKGFRKYDKIRLTLIHELAHMVHGDHDNAFKEFNSLLKREVGALDWRGGAGAKTAGGGGGGGGGVSPTAPTLGLGQPSAAAAAAAAAQKGGKVGGMEVVEEDARTAAAAAALRRAAGAGVESFPIHVGAPTTSSNAAQLTEEKAEEEGEVLPKKGDMVLYKQRDGTWVSAKVISVDVAVQPPSYGIEIDGNYRETEGHRLKRAPPPSDGDGGADAAGHYDPATEAKEAEVERLFE